MNTTRVAWILLLILSTSCGRKADANRAANSPTNTLRAETQNGVVITSTTDHYSELAPTNASAHVTTRVVATPSPSDGTVEGATDELILAAKAANGDAKSQYELGLRHANGKGVATNLSEAVRWYRAAAEQGHVESQLALAVSCLNGVGVEKDAAEAVRWFRKAADQEDKDAQRNLGYCYYSGLGVTQDYGTSASWYRKAAEQGNATSQYMLAELYYYGNGVKQDRAEAAKWYRMAALQEVAEAEAQLGHCYLHGEGVEQSYHEALRWLRVAADKGIAPAQINLALMHSNGLGTKTNVTEALKLARKAAEREHPWAQYVLGGAYANGEGVETNVTEAANWYQKAAEQGMAEAQYKLADLMFFRGYGVEQSGNGKLTVDLSGAEKWYLKAAEQGNADAQSQLGFINLLFKKDYSSAEKWLRKAADQNHAGAEYLLGSMHSLGWGMEKDYVEAAKWTQKSAEQGHVEAQSDLGSMYFSGEGVEKDYAEAYAWWNLAAKNSTNAANKRALLEERMSPAQVAEAQRRTREIRMLVDANLKKEQSQRNPFSVSEARKSAPSGSGSGFFILADGYLISNAHVVEDSAQVRLVTSAGVISAKVVKIDSANDLALLKAEGKFSQLPITPSRSIKLGASVATVGFPNIGLQGFAPKLAKGEIAALTGAADDPRYFQISVPVQPGNSGGALVDERGNVVGVVSAKLDAATALKTSGALPENVNYAVKSSFLLSFLESVPEVAAKLKEPNTKEMKFEEVVKSAEQAAVLVLVY